MISENHGRRPMNTRTLHLLTVCCLIATALVAATIATGASHRDAPGDSSAGAADTFSPFVTQGGAISRPADYRETFVHLGTYAVTPKPSQPIAEMHNVYARSEDVRAFLKDGKFPDGAPLVK